MRLRFVLTAAALLSTPFTASALLWCTYRRYSWPHTFATSAQSASCVVALPCSAGRAHFALLPLRYDKNKGTSPRNVCVPAYLSSGIFCAVLSTLYAVAVDMSNPFDM